ncbi:Amidohydrolase 1 [Ophiocordyceps camponoti-floridani]|uniref:Amidohydrolase 1 n=1 Tax=Ophiocordyceps camponoti-floridani TaxID=2030778 RepID=A0A8H4Q8S5_9HYPO|nr:Amidohydrolase 1 [Ophiocordyceps camponoti-floridani]
MTIVTIRNVDIHDVNGIRRQTNITFQRSPGNILSDSTHADDEVDGSGCTVMAGLIDAKVDTHGMPATLDRMAVHGVTTAVDSSSDTNHAQAMCRTAAESSNSPSFLFTGTIMGSVRSATLSLFPYQSVRRVATRDEAVDYVVSMVRDNGIDMFNMVLDQPGLDVETLAAAAAAAHRHGKLVMGHASQVGAYRLAVQSGCDVVTPVPLDGLLDNDLVTTMAQSGIGVIPTLVFLRNAVVGGHMAQVAYDNAVATVRTLHRAGVGICAGSSSKPLGESGDITIGHGSGLMEELELLRADVGMSRNEVLRAVTSTPAKLFQLADRGVLAEGRRADMVLVRGSPLDDAALADRILKVWVGGVEVESVVARRCSLAEGRS